MKKRRLDAEIDFSFSLFGLISAIKEYKLAWSLNAQLDIRLDKAMDIEIDFLKSQDLIISNYLYETEHSWLRLLKNKSVDQFQNNLAYLVPELKRFDYLIMLSGFEDTFTMEEFKQRFSHIRGVQYVQAFNVEDLKSKENLIF